jgi:hypothetical protein
MRPQFIPLLLLASLAIAQPSGALAYGFKLVNPAPVLVAKDTLQVTPGKPWNKAPRPWYLPRTAEVWTMDGLQLNELTFYGGIEDGKRIIRQSAVGREQQLPTFKADMTAQEVVEFVESSLRVTFGTMVFTVTSLKPMTISGQPGFQLDYESVDGDEVKRKGRVGGLIHDGKLYLLIFEAAALYYFDKDSQEVDRLLASMTLVPPAKPRR